MIFGELIKTKTMTVLLQSIQEKRSDYKSLKQMIQEYLS